MDNYEVALSKIKYQLLCGNEPSMSDWIDLLVFLEGGTDGETINNIYDFIVDNFSFEISENAEGYLYYGKLNDTVPIWKTVDEVVKNNSSYGYISSSQAGKIINNEIFQDAVLDVLKDNSLAGNDDFLFNGHYASGEIYFSDGTKVQALNDFFSENYVKNLKCPNVNTMLSGDYTRNCFVRTEFKALLENDAVKTINGIDKNVFKELYKLAPEDEIMPYLCDAIKASEVSSLKDIYYIIENIDGKDVVKIVSKDSSGATSLIDTLISGEKITSASTHSIDDILLKYDTALSQESRTILRNLSRESNTALYDILIKDSDDILSMAGKESMQIGRFTLTKGQPVIETLPNGGKVYAQLSDITSAEDAVANGYKALDGTDGKLFGMSKNGVLKVLNIAVGTFVVIDAAKTFYDAGVELQNGNYKEAGKILISYGTTMLSALGWSALMTESSIAAGVLFATAISNPVLLFAGIAGGIVGTVLGKLIGEDLGELVYNLVEHLGDGLQELYDEARAIWRYIADPLVIDLDGDGFEMLSVEDGVHFDEDNKGLAEKTEWAGAKEGLLALDINGDGKINDGSELFGTSTHLPDGTIAQSGFEALAQYDRNGDGVIDAQDEIFASLRVWQDKNSNGVTDEGELYTLADLGITGISLDATEENGRRVSQVSFQSGASVKMGEFDFAAKHYDAKEKHNIEISPEIAGLPNIQPMGNVESLHTMMQLDETGVLKAYVEQFIASQSRGEREKILTKIIYFITGAENVAAGSRGTEFDAQKLAVIEAFMGQPFEGTAGANPVNTAAEILEDMYIDIYNAYYSLLSEQTHMKDFMSMTFWTEDETGKKYLNTDIFNEFVSFCMENGCDMTDVVADMARYISSVNMENEDNFRDFLAGYADRMDYVHAVAGVCSKHVYYFQEQDADYRAGKNVDIIFGGKNNDRIDGGNGGDFIYGGDGDDAINGESGDDVLTGGKGNDILVGAGGNDTYLFNIGDGEDLVWDYEEGDIKDTEDRIIFGEGITPDSITLERDEDDLIINYGEGDRIRIKNIHKYDTNFIEYIEFADGTVWEEADIAKHSRVRTGSARNDFMRGYEKKLGYDPDEIFYAGAGNDDIRAGAGNDIIYGEDGDDAINGESGDDILIGGKGNDVLVGASGNDTYIFNKGDGEDLAWDYEEGDIKDTEDRIIFGEGITPDDITLERDEDDLIINYGEGDRIRIKNIHKYDTNFVEYIEFADGTVWGEADIAKHSRVRNGSARNDFMYGYGKKLGYDPDEIFYAGAGNDCINAGDGNDTIYGEDGDDVIYGESGDDILIGGKGNDFLVGGNGNDTYIFNKGDGEDLVWDYEEGDIKDTEDRIIFGEGIMPDDITLERNDYDLVMNYGEGDSIRIRNVYKYDTNLVEYVEFADGTTCTVDYDNAVMNIISEKNDTQDEPCSRTECCMSDAELDNMVNILVQDMSEGGADTVYDMESVETVNNVDNVQLWVQ